MRNGVFIGLQSKLAGDPDRLFVRVPRSREWLQTNHYWDHSALSDSQRERGEGALMSPATGTYTLIDPV